MSDVSPLDTMRSLFVISSQQTAISSQPYVCGHDRTVLGEDIGTQRKEQTKE
jgi:hypothetical protein